MLQEVVGTAPIARPVFALGKVCVAGCSLFSLVKIRFPAAMLYDGPANRLAAAIVLAAGVTAMALGFFSLGRSLRVGLPDDETELKTAGIYGLSRNPLYLGAFLICVASCLFAMHWLNFLFAAVAAIVHHRIVLAEERFLEARFGDQWRIYRAKVRRYL